MTGQVDVSGKAPGPPGQVGGAYGSPQFGLTAAMALCVLAFGPGNPGTTHASVSMTMAFAVVSFSAVNVGLIMRRERQAPWSSPVFPSLQPRRQHAVTMGAQV
jgi:hypothetical protein